MTVLRLTPTIVVCLLAVCLSSCFSLQKKLRDAKNGDDLARKVMKATGQDAWHEAQVITWEFQSNLHIWDRNRKLHYVKTKKFESWISLDSIKGVVKIDGRQVEGKKKQQLIDKAYRLWANDSFWMNPFWKFFDEGTKRSIVKLRDGTPMLVIHYDTGGHTPGDSFGWILDKNNLPTHWKLWVKIVPIKGYKTTWENWKIFDSGLKISQLHRSTFFDFRITNVKIGSSIKDVFRNDPFSLLF